jgi:hypothetical protein
MSTILLSLILAALLFICYQIYFAFFLPEKARRDAFHSLTEEQVEDLKTKITAEHYFKLLPGIQEPKTRRGAKKK